MTTRFVYPRIDMFYKNRGMKEAVQLAITSTTDDGKSWFGIGEAIANYCEEYGCAIDNVRWLVQVKPDDYDCKEIIAKDIEEWVRKFNALDVEYDIIPEEKWL